MMSRNAHKTHGLRRNRLLLFAGAAGLGCVLLLFPLVRSLHLDSALVAGTIGAFAGAWMAARPGARDRDVLLLTAFVYAVSIPLIIRDGLTGCLSTDGAAFWLFIPLFSVFFGFSAGRAMRYLGLPLPRLAAVLFIVAVAAGGVLLSMYFLPQLFFFNHVFGYWPGAIYDQSVHFPGRMILYRFITLGWIAAFWLIPHLRGPDGLLKGIFALILLSISLNYLLAAQHGIISPESRIRAGLGGSHQTEHFELYYSKSDFHPHEIAFLGRLHEFHFQELTDTLGIRWPEGKRIRSYLYGDEWQMQQLTGAKGVSYVPVWNRHPQMHMRKSALDGTLRHEMVHVIARQFGNRLLNASWSIGLVEGLAVALAPASSTRLTFDQMVVSNDAFYSREELERLFSLTGFYRETGPAAYAVSGSFVATLLQEYPVEHFKEAYRRSSLHAGYGDRLVDAVTVWHHKVAGVTVTEEETVLAQALFTTPSLFDERCPRTWTPAQRKRDASRFALARGDSVRAVALLEDVLDAQPRWEAGWMQWMQLRLEMGYPEKAAEEFTDAAGEHPGLMEHPLLRVRLADAHMAAGQRERAWELRERAWEPQDNALRVPERRTGQEGQSAGTGSRTVTGGPSSVAEKQAYQAWQRRSDPEKWRDMVRILYSPGLSLEHPPEFVAGSGDPLIVRVFFAEWFRRNPVPAAERIPVELVKKALEQPIDPFFFETYRNLIYLASPEVPAGFFRERLSGWMRSAAERSAVERSDGELPVGDLQEPDRQGGVTWRPIRQARLEEALRFAGS
ncbi:MAG: hypothetical protein EA363_07070 [Balneolaceae bacterium]|nr:MAG: hypothetical protein EA363_07070 [Balneolaceae bacterium]